MGGLRLSKAQRVIRLERAPGHLAPTPLQPTASSVARWYAAGVFPGKESVAEQNLARQGFDAFVPRCGKTVRHARRIVTRQAAYFPGYMFVSLDLATQRWRSVNGTLGVRSLVMQGERPIPVPSGLVEQLVAMTSEDGLLDFSGGLSEGASVRIVSGPFAEMIGRIDRLDPAGRVRVLVGLMNGQVPVGLDSRDLVVIA